VRIAVIGCLSYVNAADAKVPNTVVQSANLQIGLNIKRVVENEAL
jgi:antitoxin component of MazEF toxin-antitoxin module